MDTPTSPTRWNLYALIAEPQCEPLNAHLELLQESVSLLEATRTRLTPYLEDTEFLEILDRYELMSRTAQRLGGRRSSFTARAAHVAGGSGLMSLMAPRRKAQRR